MTLPIRPDIIELEDSKIVDVWQHGLARPDLVMLAVGEGDLPTPKFFADAAYQAMLAGETFYTHKRGIPDLRGALARYHLRHWGVEIADERIAVTSAGMNAMMVAMEIAIDSGDNMVAVSPVWPNIFATVEIMGGEVRMIALDNNGSGWHLDLDKLFAAVDDRTRVIYAASPGNPTGWTMSEEELQTLIDRRMSYYYYGRAVLDPTSFPNPPPGVTLSASQTVIAFWSSSPSARSGWKETSGIVSKRGPKGGAGRGTSGRREMRWSVIAVWLNAEPVLGMWQAIQLSSGLVVFRTATGRLQAFGSSWQARQRSR